MSRYELTDFQRRVIEPLLPSNSCGVPCVDDRCVLKDIFWVLRSGAPWRDLPERYGPRTVCPQSLCAMAEGGCLGPDDGRYEDRIHPLTNEHGAKLKHFRGVASSYHKLAATSSL